MNVWCLKSKIKRETKISRHNFLSATPHLFILRVNVESLGRGQRGIGRPVEVLREEWGRE